MDNIIIKNVHIISPEDRLDETGDIYIKDGVFAEPFGDENAVVIDGTGLCAAPGLVDLHVHLRSLENARRPDLARDGGPGSTCRRRHAPPSWRPRWPSRSSREDRR